MQIYSPSINTISPNLPISSLNSRVLSTTEYIRKIVEPQVGQYILLKILYSMYIEECNRSGSLSEHTTCIVKQYSTDRKYISGKMETVLLGYNILLDTNQRIVAQPIICQHIKLDQPVTSEPLILNVINDPVQQFITSALIERKTGYAAVVMRLLCLK